MRSETIYTDAELVDGLREGSEKAFEEIFNRYWKVLYGIALSHTMEEQTAKELVQEIFISLWERRSSVIIQSLKPYLAKSVKFAIFNFQVKNDRQKELLNSNYLAAKSFMEEPTIYSKFLEEQLNGVIDRLPEKCRLAFRYSREEGLTASEISERMGISIKTVEGHLTKALKAIRLSLNDISGLFSISGILLKFF